jgi:hypothetical protein
LPIESVWKFYPKYLTELVLKHIWLFALIRRIGKVRRALKRDPRARDYTDLSLQPVNEDEFDELEMFAVSDSAKAAVAKMRRDDDQRARLKAAS